MSPDPDARAFPSLHPGDALRPGRADPIIVLALWAARRTFWPLLLFGLSVAVGLGQFDENSISALDSVGELFGALLSPLAGVALALLVRIGVGWLALLAAWPLSRWPAPTERRTPARIYRDAIDRWRLAQAYRSLRWTWAVRAEAIRRARRLGQWLGWAVPASIVLTVVAILAFPAVVAAFGGSP